MLALETDSQLQQNILKFSHGINYKYEGQYSNSFDRFYIVTKFQLLKLNAKPIIFRKMPVDHTNCDYSSLCYSTNMVICVEMLEMAKYNIYVMQ